MGLDILKALGGPLLKPVLGAAKSIAKPALNLFEGLFKKAKDVVPDVTKTLTSFVA